MSALKTKNKLFVVDDHGLFRDGLIWILEQEKDFEVCGEASDGQEALAKLKSAKPDLILIDISMPGMSGIELTKAIRDQFPDMRILILSMHKETLYAERALRAGASGYIMKKESGRDLVAAIRHILKGQTYVSREFNETLLQKVVGAGRNVAQFSIDLLTDRELEVFQRIGQGLSTRQMAEELSISVKTIEAHREHIREKLNLSTNSDLVQHAIHWVHSEKNIA